MLKVSRAEQSSQTRKYQSAERFSPLFEIILAQTRMHENRKPSVPTHRDAGLSFVARPAAVHSTFLGKGLETKQKIFSSFCILASPRPQCLKVEKIFCFVVLFMQQHQISVILEFIPLSDFQKEPAQSTRQSGLKTDFLTPSRVLGVASSWPNLFEGIQPFRSH